jgi:Uma2 family endonuclease
MAQEARAITADELLRMPDDGYKYELVAGRLRKMTPAGSLHGVVGMRLASAIQTHVDRDQLGVVFAADTGFKLASNPDTVRAPDIAFVARERIPAGGIPTAYWPGAPDLAVEVLSPTDVRSEIDAKIDEYLRAGVRLVWFVNPFERQITVHEPGKRPVVLDERDSLNGNAGNGVLPGFNHPLARLFAFDH